jgi:hypothetical protein
VASASCEACGSRRVVTRLVEGIEVGECELCGTLQGDDEAVARAETLREGRGRGFDPRIYPLVRALEQVPTFRVPSAEPGDAGRLEYPYVFLRLESGGLVHLERLLTSLEMANRETKRRWVVEAALQRGLLFILRPRFWKRVSEITPEDIEEAQGDLDVLARVLARDTRLAWWLA